MNIIYSDIDNTFDSISEKIPQINIDAIEKLQKNGDRFVFVSGRSSEQIETVLHDIGVDCDYIFGNGAGYRIAGQPAVYKYTIDKSVFKQTKSFFDKQGLFYHLHTSSGVILEPVEKYKNAFNRLYKAFEFLGEEGKKIMNQKYNYFKSCFQTEDPFKYLDNHQDIKLIKIELMETDESLTILIEKFFKDLGFFVYSSFFTGIEIVPPQSNKGDAIRSYNKLFNPTKTFGFGDASNDISMFEAVEVSIAVDNAPDSIKALCKDRADSCVNGGVGKYILEKIL